MARVAARMVSVEVPLPPVTVVGDRLQVVAPSEEVTLHVRAKSELKLPTEATVRVVVMSPPLRIETTGLATVRVKSGGMALTVTGICSVCVRLPLVPVTVIEPEVADRSEERRVGKE